MSAILKSIGKLNAIALFAAVATLGLFYAMQLLIIREGGVSTPGHAPVIREITLPEWEPDPVRATPKPEKPDEPPAWPENPVADAPDHGPAGIRPGPLPASPPVDVSDDFFLAPADSNAMPVAQVQPVYPTRARARGVEGFVIIEFDVSETGSVINPRVLGGQPAGIFDRAALNAIARWKYNPKFIDGRAVKMTGLQTRFVFNLRE